MSKPEKEDQSFSPMVLPENESNRELLLQNSSGHGSKDAEAGRIEQKTNRKGLLAQCMVTAVLCLATVGGGMPIGYSAILLPQLKETNGTLKIDDDMGSWIASIHSAATPIGSLLSGTLMDYLGRKTALQLSNIPLIIGWILITASPNHALILLGRVVAGLSVGLVGPAGQVYLAEISDPHLRGVFGSVPFMSYSIGILLVYAMGSAAHWRLVSGLCIILPAVTMAMYFFLPESPTWLVREGRLDQARKASLWLHGGNSVQTERELEQLVERTEADKRRKQDDGESTWRYFGRSHVLKPVFIVNIFNLLQTLSGVYLIVFYAVDIISAMGGGAKIDKFLAANLTGGVRVAFAALASFLLGVTGRRVVGIGSGIGTGLAALCLSMFLYSKCPSNGYFTTICLLAYVGANTVGLMMLPGVMVGELFPIKVRGIAGSVAFTLFNLMIFGITKLFPFIKTFMSIADVFALFGVSALLTALFVYIFVPETKDVSLNEIEDYFMQDNFMWITRKKKGSQDDLYTNNNVCEKS